MDAIKSLLEPFLNTLGEFLPNVVGALLILILGWLLAALLKKLTLKLLTTVKLDERLQRDAKEGRLSVSRITANVVYYLFLLCVLLLVLDILGVDGVLDPAKAMLDEFLSVLPNIVAAVLIGIVGYILAKMVSAATTALSKGLDGFAGKIGLSDSFSFSRILGQLAFLFIFIPVLMAGLDALEIAAISVPATDMLQALISAIPKILGALLILAIAFFLGRFVAVITTDLLANMGADEFPKRFGLSDQLGERIQFSKFCGGLVLFFVMLTAAISAAQKLDMTEVAFIFSNLLTFAGRVIMGLIILAIGNILANLAYTVMKLSKNTGHLAALARYAIIALVLAMGLQAMGIADDIVKLAFGLSVGAVAVALALSFGLGGREAAGKQMEHWLSKFREGGSSESDSSDEADK